jgi:type I restriction enzyme M protein
MFIEDDDVLTPGNAVVRTVYDPTAGTGGMLSVAGEYLLEHNPQARLTMFGQELNDDGHGGRQFDYMLSNPPFGVAWKKVERAVRLEHEQRGFEGRFGPGLPRVSDGSLLFRERPAVPVRRP